MGTILFPCGCMISTDMFNGQCVGVTACPSHRAHEKYREALRALRAALDEAHKELKPESVK